MRMILKGERKMPGSVTTSLDQEAIDSLYKGHDSPMGRFLAGKAGQVTQVAKRKAPVKTGALRNSISSRSSTTSSGVSFEVIADVDYAIYQEEGTSRTPAVHFLSEALEEVFGNS